MTFALAGLTPIPGIVAPSDDGFPINGVAFVADTRYTRRDGRHSFDRGIKLCGLTDTAACVVAGDVDWALWAARRAQAFFDEYPRPTRARAHYTIGRRLKRMNRFLRQRGFVPRYAISIGYLTESNSPDVFCFGPDDGIWAQATWGFALGRADLLPDYDLALHSVLSDVSESGQRFTARPVESGMYYAAALHRAFLERPKEPTIGGGLQFAVLTPDQGLRRHEFSWMKAGSGDPTLAASWSRVTRDVQVFGNPWLPKKSPTPVGWAVGSSD